MKRVLYFLSLVLIGLFWCGTVQTENIYVEDHANVLSSESRRTNLSYNQKYKELELRPQLAVVTLKQLPADQSIRELCQ